MALLHALSNQFSIKYLKNECSCINVIISNKEYFKAAIKGDNKWFWIVTHHLYFPYKVLHILQKKYVVLDPKAKIGDIMNYKVLNYDLSDIQNIMLQMMIDIDRVCKKHGIRYILDGGSMLGAVRHKGFIPWDDDLDIAMLRDDYVKFIKIANEELDDKYCFQCIENTKEYPYNFGKVFCTNTTFLEHFTANLDICHGIYIDVFPMDYVDIKHLKMLSFRRRLVSKFTQIRYMKLKIINETMIKRFISMLIPMKLVNVMCKKNMMYHYKRSQYVQKMCHYGKNKPPVNASLFTDTIRVPFEKYVFPIPREYDRFLRERYGDYMQLPSISDQKPVHHIIEVKI